MSEKPSNCRNRLRDEGKAYPRSSCGHCGNGGLMGCPFEKPTPPASHDAGDFIDKAAADIPALTMMTARAEQAEEELRCADQTITTLTAERDQYKRERDEAREETLLTYNTFTKISSYELAVERMLPLHLEIDDTLNILERQRNDATKKLAASEARVVVLEKSLRHYGTHSDHCEKSRFVNPSVCTCGYDAALSQPGCWCSS